MELNTGIPEEARREISEGLARLLADTYTLYLKTQGYHWNVSGPMFRSLHLMFEEQYMDLRDAADAIAERILSLGNPAAATIDRTYVRATADSWSPIAPETPGWDYAEIDTGHWPMFTKPLELAGLLDAVPIAVR